MVPPTLPLPAQSSYPALIQAVPLSAAAFAPFGTAILSPLPSDLTSAPASLSELPPREHGNPSSPPMLANQGSAVKHSNISVYHERYLDAPSASMMETPSGLNGSPQVPFSKAKPAISMFSCFPRRTLQLRQDGHNDVSTFPVRILERHPFTTQTFTPLKTSPGTSSTGHRARYLVIVAPSLPAPLPASTMATAIATGRGLIPSKVETNYQTTVDIQNPPDLSKVKAFIAEPGMAVTYGAGTWHAPMVVLGDSRIDFVVVQWVSGVPEEDCEEVLLGEQTGHGDQAGIEVVIESDWSQGSGLHQETKQDSQASGLWQPRLHNNPARSRL